METLEEMFGQEKYPDFEFKNGNEKKMFHKNYKGKAYVIDGYWAMIDKSAFTLAVARAHKIKAFDAFDEYSEIYYKNSDQHEYHFYKEDIVNDFGEELFGSKFNYKTLGSSTYLKKKTDWPYRVESSHPDKEDNDETYTVEFDRLEDAPKYILDFIFNFG
jgi:hypothetical protein